MTTTMTSKRTTRQITYHRQKSSEASHCHAATTALHEDDAAEDHPDDHVIDTLLALLKQERTGYAPCNREHKNQLPNLGQLRRRVAHWMYEIVDRINLSRETVSIAMNYLDRYFAANAIPCHESSRQKLLDQLQLAGMTSLYMAIKIHEPIVLNLPAMCRLSGYLQYSEQDFCTMEVAILNTLQWRVHPPTILAFVRQMMQMIPMDLLEYDVRYAIYDVCKYLSELAVLDAFFVKARASVTAFVVLGTALESSLGNDPPGPWKNQVAKRIQAHLIQALRSRPRDSRPMLDELTQYKGLMRPKLNNAVFGPKQTSSRSSPITVAAETMEI